MKNRIRNWWYGFCWDESGMGVVEVILIIVEYCPLNMQYIPWA